MHHPITESYNFVLVLLSFTIALLASYTALNLARKVSSSEGWYQKSWMICSAIVMGVGIWSMHFIAMLAYELPEGVTYDISLVSISIVVAVIGALIGVFVTFQGNFTRTKLIISGTTMGFAISGMHYIGMSALQHVTIRYQPVPFMLSIIIAIFASITALYLFIKRSQRIAISGLIMGIAITGMHYTGMAAAIMTMEDASHHASGNGVSMDFFVVAMYVAFGTILIFAFSFISSLSSDRRLAEQIALKASILESAIDGILMFKAQGRIIEFNPAAEGIFGYTRKEALHLTIFDLLFLFDQDGQDAADLYKQLTQKVDSIIGKRFEIMAYRSNHLKFPAEVVITNLFYAGKLVYTAYLRDLTEIRKSEELIQKLAYYDHLTGLPNRNQFNQLIEDILNRSHNNQDTVAVLFLDIYRFKWINDSFGHLVGDHVLKQFSALVSSNLPANGSASRLSGDEFVILLPHGDREIAENHVIDIMKRLEIPLQVDGREFYVSTNIGISLYPQDGQSSEILLKNADQAMYAAKEQGPNNYRFFRKDMKTKFTQRVAIEQQLRHAIDNDELTLVYQPKFDACTCELVGMEALLRWHNEELGSISPQTFIPVAEESRQIIEIGHWVLHTAAAQMKKWQDAGLGAVSMAVNISAVQLHHEQFIPSIHEILQTYQLEPKWLELEMTESIEINRSSMLEKLRTLNRMGVRLAVDDFGTGYSSISYLQKFPINSLKIDKSFVQRISGPHSDHSLIEAIIAMGRSLKLEVIAEGVETEDQLAYLKSHGCHQVQGYLFAAPLTAEEFEALYVKGAKLNNMA
jgi:diguanylate cyclase (GGDEF)-like protein/PAS domain S-box-containing protein